MSSLDIVAVAYVKATDDFVCCVLGLSLLPVRHVTSKNVCLQGKVGQH